METWWHKLALVRISQRSNYLVLNFEHCTLPYILTLSTNGKPAVYLNFSYKWRYQIFILSENWNWILIFECMHSIATFCLDTFIQNMFDTWSLCRDIFQSVCRLDKLLPVEYSDEIFELLRISHMEYEHSRINKQILFNKYKKYI